MQLPLTRQVPSRLFLDPKDLSAMRKIVYVFFIQTFVVLNWIVGAFNANVYF